MPTCVWRDRCRTAMLGIRRLPITPHYMTISLVIQVYINRRSVPFDLAQEAVDEPVVEEQSDHRLPQDGVMFVGRLAQGFG